MAKQETKKQFETLPQVCKERAGKDYPFECEVSVDVLVQLEGFKGWWIGRYIHALGEWQVNGWSGSPVVVAWHPLPELDSFSINYPR